MLGARAIPWASANLNHAAQGLIISTGKSVLNQLIIAVMPSQTVRLQLFISPQDLSILLHFIELHY